MIDRNLLDEIINKYYWYRIYLKKDGDERDEVFTLVKAIETKSVYGRIDVLVKPVIGRGQFWVKYDKLFLEKIPFGIIAESVYKIKFLDGIEKEQLR